MIAKWVIYFTIAFYMIWRIITLGFAEYYSKHAIKQQHALIALEWRINHPQALFEQARTMSDLGFATLEQLLQRAAWFNPTDSKIYLLLARLLENNGTTERASGLTIIADQLSPMQSAAQLDIANFWLKQGKLDKFIEHINTVLRLHSKLRPRLYPIIVNMLEIPEARSALKMILRDSPEWWDDFFRYAAVNTPSVNTLRFFFQLQAKPSDSQRLYYMRRLQREKLWAEMFFVWVNSLGSQELKYFGNLYNGGFELPPSNEGFDWYLSEVKGVTAETTFTKSRSDNRAIRVHFRGLRTRFQHLFQYLFLKPGQYELRGRVKLEDLRAERGLMWSISCENDQKKLLAVSEHFLGTHQWRWFTVEFRVPDSDCVVQNLRLALAGRVALDFQAKGTAWFDEMIVERVD